MENYAMRRNLIVGSLLCFTGFAHRSSADIIVPGANGSDGRLNCGTFQTPPNPAYPCDIACSLTAPIVYTIDLSLAENKHWDVSPVVPGHGVYDSEKWAVVFKYPCVNIPSNVTIRFKNHPSRAPVVWLVDGPVNIAGQIILDASAQAGAGGAVTEPGPGGFRGGGRDHYAGLGPGGGWYNSNSTLCRAAGSYGGTGNIYGSCGVPPPYGNGRIIPLIGGSGGSPWDCAGGAGGGAILIASTSTISLSGTISALGSDGCGEFDGSGGAIRLVAESVSESGNGNLAAHGRNLGGQGRIRIEANMVNLPNVSSPAHILGTAGSQAVLWDSDLGPAPSIRIVSVGSCGAECTANTDPRAGLSFPGTDIVVPSSGVQLVVMDAQNVPLDWLVYTRVVRESASDATVPAVFVSGDATHSTWQATVGLNSGFSVLQARAAKPPAAAAAREDENSVEVPAEGGKE